jgi:trypsin
VHQCAGVIYDERRIITAGYCLENVNARELTVVAGATDYVNLRGDEQSIATASIQIHENYNNPQYEYNIGILTLAEPLIFRQNVQPIRLAIPTIEASGEVQVVGWGTLDEETYPSKLQKVTLDVVDRQTCARDFSVIGFDVTSNMVCASAPRRSTCGGDGGGPLIAKDEARRPYLAGIVSWTLSPCALDGYHSLFTNIAALRPWLESKLNP